MSRDKFIMRLTPSDIIEISQYCDVKTSILMQGRNRLFKIPELTIEEEEEIDRLFIKVVEDFMRISIATMIVEYAIKLDMDGFRLLKGAEA